MPSSKLSLPPCRPIPIYATQLVYCLELYNIYYWKVLLMILDTDLSKLLLLHSDFHILLFSFIFCRINYFVILAFAVAFLQV